MGETHKIAQRTIGSEYANNSESQVSCLLPSEDIELTANSLGAHIETRGKLILRTLSYLAVNSQDDSCCELAVSFP